MKRYCFDKGTADTAGAASATKTERWGILSAANGAGTHGLEDARTLQTVIEEMVAEDGASLMGLSDRKLAYLFAEQMCLGIEDARGTAEDGGCSLCLAFIDRNDGHTTVVCYGTAAVLRVGRDEVTDLSPEPEGHACLVTDADAAAKAVVLRFDLQDGEGVLIGTDALRSALAGDRGETLRTYLKAANKAAQVEAFGATLADIAGTESVGCALAVYQEKNGGEA